MRVLELGPTRFVFGSRRLNDGLLDPFAGNSATGRGGAIAHFEIGFLTNARISFRITSRYLGSFGSARCVKPTTIPKAWSLPNAIESAPAASGRSPFDFRKSFAFARSLVFKTIE